MLDPGDERFAFGSRRARGLMCKIGAYIAVGENDLALLECGFQLRLGFETIAGVKQRREVRIDGFERTEMAVEELADHFSEPGVVVRETSWEYRVARGNEGLGQVLDLGAFAAAVDSFDGDEFSGRRHV